MNHGSSQGQAVNVNLIIGASFAMTVVVVLALVAVDVIPLWIAATVLLFDGFVSYLIVSKLGRATSS